MGKTPIVKKTYPKNDKTLFYALFLGSGFQEEKVLFEHLFFYGGLTWRMYIIIDTDRGVLMMKKKEKKKLEMQMTMG